MKTNRLFMTVGMVGLLVGCSYVTPEELEKGNKLCENNSGVEMYIFNEPLNSLENIREVKCNNGAVFHEDTIYGVLRSHKE